MTLWARYKYTMYIDLGGRFLPDILGTLDNPETIWHVQEPENAHQPGTQCQVDSNFLRTPAYVCIFSSGSLSHYLCSCYSSMHSRKTALVHSFVFPSPSPNPISDTQMTHNKCLCNQELKHTCLCNKEQKTVIDCQLYGLCQTLWIQRWIKYHLPILEITA